MFVFTSHQTGLDTRSFFYSGGFREGRCRTGAENLALLVHRLTRCNTSQMTLLDFDSLNITWVRHVCLPIAWTRPEGLVPCCAINVVRPPKGWAHSALNLTLILGLVQHKYQMEPNTHFFFNQLCYDLLCTFSSKVCVIESVINNLLFLLVMVDLHRKNITQWKITLEKGKVLFR